MTTPSDGSASSESIDPAVLQQRIALAKTIVGSNPPDNSSLFLEQTCDFERKHISPLRKKGAVAASLVDTLTQPQSIKSAIDGYRIEDAAAVAARKIYSRKAQRVDLPLAAAVFLAVALAVLRPENVISAIELVMRGLNYAEESLGFEKRLFGEQVSQAYGDGIKRTWQLLPFLVFGLLAYNVYLQWRCSAHVDFEAWKKARATAEAFRRELFRRMMAEPLPLAADEKASALLLRLEYFRRWQGEVQLAYFDGQQKAHAKKLRREQAAKWFYWAMATTLFLVMLISSVSTLDEQGARSFLPVGVAGLLSKASIVEGLGLDVVLLFAILLAGAMWKFSSANVALEDSRRLAARYDIMRDNFNDILGKRLQDTRLEAATGNERAVREYMMRVHSMMSLELNDWVRLSDLDRGKDSDAAYSKTSDTPDDREHDPQPAAGWPAPLTP